jgi:hypothetical protein
MQINVGPTNFAPSFKVDPMHEVYTLDQRDSESPVIAKTTNIFIIGNVVAKDSVDS